MRRGLLMCFVIATTLQPMRVMAGSEFADLRRAVVSLKAGAGFGVTRERFNSMALDFVIEADLVGDQLAARPETQAVVDEFREAYKAVAIVWDAVMSSPCGDFARSDNFTLSNVEINASIPEAKCYAKIQSLLDIPIFDEAEKERVITKLERGYRILISRLLPDALNHFRYVAQKTSDALKK
jgi:hypothetical protein